MHSSPSGLLTENLARARISPLLKKTFLAVAGTALLTLSAKLQVPFYPVPITMQTLVVLLIGATLGTRLGGATLLLYLLEGAIGLPVFAGTPQRGIGIAYMVGPTGGYLAGFFLAAVLVGALAERGGTRTTIKTILVLLSGFLAIYLPGLLWLSRFVPHHLLAVGWMPFLFGDLLKIMIATCLLTLMRPKR